MQINRLACFSLIALRLVIGWHFLVEGYYKIRSHQIGKTSTNAPWTSEPFFREAYGPFADWYRQQLGISDDAVLARLWTLGDIELDDFVNRLERHHELSAQQRAAARSKFDSAKLSLAARFLGKSQSDVSKPFVWVPVEVRQSVFARLREYEAKKKQIREIQNSEQPAFNNDVGAARVRTLKVESAQILNDLIAELNSQMAAMKAAVTEAANLTDAQKAKGPVPDPPSPPRMIDRLDKVTMWMQAVLGGFLVIGLFTRLSSLMLAGFLLQVVILMPALPTATPPPGEMGHYLYVDMHVIEMVALLVLAAIPTGRWFGLDALLGKRGASSAAK